MCVCVCACVRVCVCVHTWGEEGADTRTFTYLEGGTEGGNQLRRQLLDEADRVREEASRRRGAALLRVYRTSFQKAAFRRQAITVKASRNSRTQTPTRTRVFCTGSAIHWR